MIPRHIPSMMIAALLSACGGGGGSAPAPVPPTGGPPTVGPTDQSAGGIWGGPTRGVGDLSLYITEDGRLWSVTPAGPNGGPAFGSGAVSVNNGNEVSGGYEATTILPFVANTGPLTCQLDGTVSERVSLTVDVSCADASGPVWEDSATLFPLPGYNRSSELAAIAGNYALGFGASTNNSININGDGMIFGRYDNGVDCTVNGQVAIIDPDFNLYDVTWTYSDCSGFFDEVYNGVEFSGIATIDDVIGGGGFYLLMTGFVEDRLDFISVIYEPV